MNLQELIKTREQFTQILPDLEKSLDQIQMNEDQKIQVLEHCWTRWSYLDLTDESEMQKLEGTMHHLITPYNASESVKIENDILINHFIALKLQEDSERHEMITSPNSYYGAL